MKLSPTRLITIASFGCALALLTGTGCASGEPIAQAQNFENDLVLKKSAQLENRTINYFESGSGQSTILVLGNSPNGPSISSNDRVKWQEVLARLRFSGRALVPDLSLGQTYENLSLEAQYQSLKAFSDKLQLKNIHLVVVDSACPLGFLFAERLADRISSIVIVEESCDAKGVNKANLAESEKTTATQRQLFNHSVERSFEVIRLSQIPKLLLFTDAESSEKSRNLKEWKSSFNHLQIAKVSEDRRLKALDQPVKLTRLINNWVDGVMSRNQ